MEKYLYINYASQDNEIVKKIAQEIEAAGISTYCGETSKRRVAESACVLNCATKNSRDSKSYRKVAEYAQKHMIDSISIHLDEDGIVSDVEMQLDLLHILFKYHCKNAFHESVQAEVEEMQENIDANHGEAEKAETVHNDIYEMVSEHEGVIDGDRLSIAADEAIVQNKLASKNQMETSEEKTDLTSDSPKQDEDEKVVVGNFEAFPETKEELFVEGMKLLNSEDEVDKGFGYLMQAATQGHVEAQYQLSMCYDSGIGAKRSITEAAKWCQMAAYGGHAQAQSEIGYCYESGRGVIRNVKEAVRWYEMASSQGNVDAKNNLAFCYQKGRGVQKDVTKAIQLYTEAAELGHASSQYNLGYCYWYGEGVEIDKEKAIAYFEQSALNGNAKAGQMLKILNQRAFRN